MLHNPTLLADSNIPVVLTGNQNSGSSFDSNILLFNNNGQCPGKNLHYGKVQLHLISTEIVTKNTLAGICQEKSLRNLM